MIKLTDRTNCCVLTPQSTKLLKNHAVEPVCSAFSSHYGKAWSCGFSFALLAFFAMPDVGSAQTTQKFYNDDVNSAPFSSGVQEYYDRSKFDAKSANSVTGGTQGFWDTSHLDASVAEAITDGAQNFWGSTALNATAANAINGGIQKFGHGSKLNITATHGLSGGIQTFNRSGLLGVQPELNANASEAIIGGTQTFQEGAILNAGAFKAVNGGIQKFEQGSVLNATVSNAVSGGEQIFNGTSKLNASATDAISGGAQSFWDSTVLNATVANAINGGTQNFGHDSKLNITVSNGLSGGVQRFHRSRPSGLGPELNASVSDAITGGAQTLELGAVLNATAPKAINGGKQEFKEDSLLKVDASNALSGGEQIFKDSAKLNANASFAISGGNQEFLDNAVLEAGKADAVSGGVQKFQHRSVLNASASRSISGGEQNFFTNAELHANATETITGGTQNFQNSSILTTNMSHAITGGSQRFEHVSQLNLNAPSAVSGGQQSFSWNATLNLSAPNAISGGIQDYSDSSVINANVSDAVNGLTLTLKHDTTLNAHETYSVNNSTVLLLDKATINFLAPDSLAPTTRVIFSGGKLDLKNHDYKITPLKGTAGTIVSGTGTLLIDQVEDGVFGGSIVGSNRLVKTGTKQLLLSGDSSGFTGTTNLNAGSLAVNGKLGGNVNVASSAVLGGRGVIGSGANSMVTIASGGTLSPGNSIGTITINGDLTFAAGSKYRVEVDPQSTASDLTYVTGRAQLNGGSVLHIGENGVYNPLSSYRILTADNGVNGKFDNVVSNLAFLKPELVYTGNNVELQMYRNDIKFVEKAGTFNEKAIAGALDSMPVGGSKLYNAMASLSNDEASIKRSLNSLSGEAYASVKNTLVDDSRYIRSAAYGRLEQAFNVGSSTSASPKVNDTTSADMERYAAWGHAYGDWSDQSGDGNAAKIKSTVGGFVSGVDAAVYDNWRLGIMAGYSRSTFKVTDRSSSGSSENYTIGTYAGSEWGMPNGAIGLRSGLSYTWHNLEMSRNVAFNGFSDNLSADYNAGTFQVFGEVGYKYKVTERSILEPYANLAYVNVKTDGFAEKGKDGAALNVHSDTMDAVLSTIGIRASTQFDLGGIVSRARIDLGWGHAFGDRIPQSTAHYVGSESFSVAGIPIAENTVRIETGLDFNLSQNTTFGILYHGQFGSGVKQNGLNANLNMRF